MQSLAAEHFVAQSLTVPKPCAWGLELVSNIHTFDYLCTKICVMMAQIGERGSSGHAQNKLERERESQLTTAIDIYIYIPGLRIHGPPFHAVVPAGTWKPKLFLRNPSFWTAPELLRKEILNFPKDVSWRAPACDACMYTFMHASMHCMHVCM